MFISEVYAAGFRCFGSETPLHLKLHRGLNILVGPNDAGKTAVIDAPRYLLWTRTDEFLRLDPADFHVKPTGKQVTELLIRCTFDELTATEQAQFMEWCTNEGGTFRLHVCLRGTLRKQPGGGLGVSTQFRSGKDGDGLSLDGDLREYLKATYLRPLRDAERELRSGRRSRLSKILGALPNMARQSQVAPAGESPSLTDTMSVADGSIDTNDGVVEVQRLVNTDYLKPLSFSDDLLTAKLGLGVKGSYEQLLERLELYLNPPPGYTQRLNRGLGYNNLLFMAAELLVLQSDADQIPFLLIEEPEAHLHPQHQALFMEVLEKRTIAPQGGQPGQQVQVLLTTHSPQLAASADLNSMVMLSGHKAFALGEGHTKLEKDDYGFLRRFLDATKANLFFARGVIVVEGDAENILLPALAKKIGKPLGQHGVSIVNVGHRGLFRYSRIFQRASNVTMPVPVALLPDRDIPPDAAGALVGDRKTESAYDTAAKQEHESKLKAHDGGSVRTFLSEQWTLEYDLARQPQFALYMHQAIRAAKGEGGKMRAQVLTEAGAEVAAWQADTKKTPDDVAVEIFTPLHKKQVSKAQVAEQLAQILSDLPDDPAFAAKLPAYLVEAIEHATSPAAATAAAAGNTAAA